jgi:hypothetical protein
MTREEKIAATDAIVRDLFAKGGPMRPTAIRGSGRVSVKVKHRPSPVLEAEQRRLIKTWGKS